jgi:hypothetical protein
MSRLFEYTGQAAIDVALSMVLGLALTATAGCDVFFQQWDGFVYPDRSNLTRSVYVGKFKTLEDCRVAALAILGQNRQGDYECGLNCKPQGGINVCSRTER